MTACELSSDSRTRPEINVAETERILSIAGGALVLLCALDRRPVSALVGFALGGGLLYRGITGHCSVYQALGVCGGDVQNAVAGSRAQSSRRVESGVDVAHRNQPKEPMTIPNDSTT